MQKTMQQESLDACELASALADGELRDAEFERALAVLQASEEAQQRWHTYHLVGDVLRSGAGAAVAAHDPAFVERMRQRLQAQEGRPQRVLEQTLIAVPHSANDAVWRWKLVAGLSSLAVVAVLGWQLVAQRPDAGAGSQLAVAPAVTVPVQLAAGDAPVMIRDPQLDRLIAEHQQLGGTSALQMPAGFLRNATFERPAR